MIILEEIWKDVVGYEGRYMVSNLGNIKSVIFKRKGKEQTLSLLKGKDYLLVRLYKNGVGSMQRVHRLVAEAFIENPNNYPVVNHKNWNRHDNRADNLEWCTYQYNNSHRNPETKPKPKPKEKRQSNKNFANPKQIICVETGETFESISSAARHFNIEQSNISRVLNGRQRTCGGYHWKYVNEDDKSIGTLSLNNGQITEWIPLLESKNKEFFESGIFDLCDLRKMKGHIRFRIRTTDGKKELCIFCEGKTFI